MNRITAGERRGIILLILIFTFVVLYKSTCSNADGDTVSTSVISSASSTEDVLADDSVKPASPIESTIRKSRESKRGTDRKSMRDIKDKPKHNTSAPTPNQSPRDRVIN